MDISYSSVQRVAKRYKYHPYKCVKVQQLLSNDFERRLHFVAQMVTKLDDDPTILSNILWTDEARFHNNGQVNHHNQHYWSEINPNWALESNVQSRWSINVWCGLIDEHLVGPYFYEGNLNGKKYLHFLKNKLPVLLEDLPLSKRKYLLWQQDGAPAHNYLQVQDYLNNIYGSNYHYHHILFYCCLKILKYVYKLYTYK